MFVQSAAARNFLLLLDKGYLNAADLLRHCSQTVFRWNAKKEFAWDAGQCLIHIVWNCKTAQAKRFVCYFACFEFCLKKKKEKSMLFLESLTLRSSFKTRRINNCKLHFKRFEIFLFAGHQLQCVSDRSLIIKQKLRHASPCVAMSHSSAATWLQSLTME